VVASAAVAQSNEIDQWFRIDCSTTGNYTRGSQFEKNLNQLLANLSAGAIAGDWFNTNSVGTGPDQVFALIMCYADVGDATRCKECLARAPAGVRQECPGSRAVTASNDACLLRYSDKPFFSPVDVTYNASTNISYTKAGDQIVVQNMATMNNTRWQLLSMLAERAGDNTLRIDNRSEPYVDSLLGTSAMYGLAQCTRD
uniref:Gnk2-homologous domain-containing protein n=1 Tax=Oryza glaberrima TaxID=4538 RepID=I1R7R0_ORYGL